MLSLFLQKEMWKEYEIGGTNMLDMKLNSGSLTIDDNNNMIVDESMEKEIKKGFEENDDNNGKEIKNMTVIKD